MLCRVIRIKDRGQDVRAGVLAWASGERMSDVRPNEGRVPRSYRTYEECTLQNTGSGGRTVRVRDPRDAGVSQKIQISSQSRYLLHVRWTFGGDSVEVRWRFGGDL